ncbi:hypothetical protein GCM10027347_52790 [Larkinella harenae]
MESIEKQIQDYLSSKPSKLSEIIIQDRTADVNAGIGMGVVWGRYDQQSLVDLLKAEIDALKTAHQNELDIQVDRHRNEVKDLKDSYEKRLSSAEQAGRDAMRKEIEAEYILMPRSGQPPTPTPEPPTPTPRPEEPKPDTPQQARIDIPAKDFRGTSVTESDPVVFEAVPVKNPRPQGNHVAFAEQQAQFVLNPNRFRRIRSSGAIVFIWHFPVFGTYTQCPVIEMGASHIHAYPKLRQGDQPFFTKDSEPASRRAAFMYDAHLYEMAGIWAGRRAKAIRESGGNPDQDAVYVRLMQLCAGPKIDNIVMHRMVTHKPTVDYLAPFILDEFLNVQGQGAGVDFITFDVETNQHSSLDNVQAGKIPEHNLKQADQYRFLGMLYDRVCELGAEKGFALRPFTYSDGLINAGGKQWNKEDKDNLLNYLTGPDKNRPYSSSDHPYILMLKKWGGAVGNGNYFPVTWSHGTWYDKDASGKYIIKDGARVTRSTDHEAMLYGQLVPFKGIDQNANGQKEADVALMHANKQLALIQSYLWAFNDARPAFRYSDRIDVFRNVAVAEWMRYDTEPLHSNPGGKAFGERPVNPHMITNALLDRAPFCHQSGWCAEPRYEFGKDQQGGISAKGPLEIILLALKRAENMIGAFKNKHKDFYIGFPFQNYVDEFGGDPNRTNARYAQKNPPIWLLSEGNDLLVKACYLAQDEEESRTLTITHTKVPGWKAELQMIGRDAATEWFVLPEAVGDCNPKDLRLSFTDLVGEKRTVAGDWHYKV